MPTKLGMQFSPLWRGKYPHMLKEDYPVWESYLNRFPTLFERIYYDVLVGGVIDTNPATTQKEKDMFFANTAKRIDALGETKDELWLIEVAQRPGLRATGQLMTYLALWHQDPAINKPLIAVLVCDTVDEDVRKAIEFYGMHVRDSFSH